MGKQLQQLPRSKVRSGQKIESSDGHEKRLEKRQNRAGSVGKWAPAVLLKVLGFSWRVSETLWVGTGTGRVAEGLGTKTRRWGLTRGGECARRVQI